ncbi:MAG: hypothetical protein RMK97_07305 [Sutterellaceae bacterium]|nr:hypothetical protein [Burkholderiaceae bacterium]MDW8430292.1 hypothetical protein [Sutterellaceae bacterium]
MANTHSDQAVRYGAQQIAASLDRALSASFAESRSASHKSSATAVQGHSEALQTTGIALIEAASASHQCPNPPPETLGIPQLARSANAPPAGFRWNLVEIGLWITVAFRAAVDGRPVQKHIENQ